MRMEHVQWKWLIFLKNEIDWFSNGGTDSNIDSSDKISDSFEAQTASQEQTQSLT